MNKTKINAVIVGDSICPRGHRITSLLVTMPRIILAEFNTHRMFSRNTSSSRAIPFKRMLKTIEEDPFIPIAFQREHSGMQGNQYITDEKSIKLRIDQWISARDKAIFFAKDLSSSIRLNQYPKYENEDIDLSPVTKQIANRLLEPFMWCTVLVTATEWSNFFSLRCPQYVESDNLNIKYKSKKDFIKDYPKAVNLTTLEWLKGNLGMAEIHMMQVAECIYDAINESVPKQLEAGEWHIPFEDKIDLQTLHNMNFIEDVNQTVEGNILKLKVKISTAMAARTSYTVVGEEKELNYENLINLHDRLISQVPRHSSPMEHIVRVPTVDEYRLYSDAKRKSNNYEIGWFDNFHGFIPYRKLLENETSI